MGLLTRPHWSRLINSGDKPINCCCHRAVIFYFVWPLLLSWLSPRHHRAASHHSGRHPFAKHASRPLIQQPVHSRFEGSPSIITNGPPSETAPRRLISVPSPGAEECNDDTCTVPAMPVYRIFFGIFNFYFLHLVTDHRHRTRPGRFFCVP